MKLYCLMKFIFLINAYHTSILMINNFLGGLVNKFYLNKFKIFLFNFLFIIQLGIYINGK